MKPLRKINNTKNNLISTIPNFFERITLLSITVNNTQITLKTKNKNVSFFLKFSKLK